MNLSTPEYHIAGDCTAPAEIGEQAEAEGATPAQQIQQVADALIIEVQDHHHPLIPTAAVRAHALRLLTAATADTWYERAAHTYRAIESALLDGTLYEQAAADGPLPVSVRLGQHISAAAEKRIRAYPGRHEMTVVDPEGIPVSSIVAETFQDVLDDARERGWLPGNTSLSRAVEQVSDELPAETAEALRVGQMLDELPGDTAKALLQHFTAIPAEQIGFICPSQILADARAAGARPEHVLDAVAVGIASVMAPVAGIDFHELLPKVAADVRTSADGWVAETVGIKSGGGVRLRRGAGRGQRPRDARPHRELGPPVRRVRGVARWRYRQRSLSGNVLSRTPRHKGSGSPTSF
ncbi:hypothetical protein [Nonomuraea sp. NPDC049141]|uniref:hypothetical protein n=1 Tax=Nonomuraea sp. NPDC049141 TaxID=3155500 RepID=UPI0033DC1D9A